MFRIVAATRLDRAGFLAESLLGRSMERVVVPDAVELAFTYENTIGLPDIYNAALAGADDAHVMILVHDDVWIDDWFLLERVR